MNLTKKCLYCGKEFSKKSNESKKDWLERHKFCSKTCAAKNRYHLHNYQFRKGDKAINPIQLGEHLSTKTEFKKGNIPWNYRDGLSKNRHTLRKSNESKKWARDVLRRDHFVCQKCGKIGGKLRAHHKNNFAKFDDQRYVLDNGVTLCVHCHKDIHRIYGYNTTEENWNEFISLKLEFWGKVSNHSLPQF